jgi:hydroxymethylglutaryl-CoA reductase
MGRQVYDPAAFAGFFRLSRDARQRIMAQQGILQADDLAILAASSADSIQDQADTFVENAIGCFPIPLGVATNCVINGQPRLIPMAVEETSIIAALSSAAKWVNQSGGRIQTTQCGWGIRGQLFYTRAGEPEAVSAFIAENRDQLIRHLEKQVVPTMVKRGGGIRQLSTRMIVVADRPALAVDIVLDAREAMGANLVCQIAEALKKHIENTLGIAGKLAIVSNLSDCQITEATLTVPQAEPGFAEAIVEANAIAQADPYRAVTHNKGVLNGIDAVAIATGNDWRAIEASLHGYAAREGGYQPLTTWQYHEGTLVGKLSAPIPVAHVGGATSQAVVGVCKRILGVESAQELASIMAAVGLLQNFAALRALVGEGIVAGHMRLHIDNLMAETAVASHERAPLRRLLEERLCMIGKVTMTDVIELLPLVKL